MSFFKKKYSNLLNGYWEEGYHYYMEFRDGHLTVRDYRRSVTLETEISYDASALERGERTVLSLKDNVLSRDGSGNPFTMIRELAYENGELKMLYYYTIMGETLYTLKKTDRGPFDHIRIRDDEFLKQLQGKWYDLKRGTEGGFEMVIDRNRIRAFGTEFEPFHVVSRDYAPDWVVIVPENLIDGNFRGYTEVEVRPDMLVTRMMITDCSVPATVFVRKDMLGKMELPPEAQGSIRNTMYVMMD